MSDQWEIDTQTYVATSPTGMLFRLANPSSLRKFFSILNKMHTRLFFAEKDTERFEWLAKTRLQLYSVFVEYAVGEGDKRCMVPEVRWRITDRPNIDAATPQQAIDQARAEDVKELEDIINARA